MQIRSISEIDPQWVDSNKNTRGTSKYLYVGFEITPDNEFERMFLRGFAQEFMLIDYNHIVTIDPFGTYFEIKISPFMIIKIIPTKLLIQSTIMDYFVLYEDSNGRMDFKEQENGTFHIKTIKWW